MSVVIQGESGTGKEIIANSWSIKKVNMQIFLFVAIDCGASSEEIGGKWIIWTYQRIFTGVN